MSLRRATHFEFEFWLDPKFEESWFIWTLSFGFKISDSLFSSKLEGLKLAFDSWSSILRVEASFLSSLGIFMVRSSASLFSLSKRPSLQ